MTFPLAVYSFLIIMIAYIVKGLVGFGDPLLSNPLLAMWLDNKDITPALLPVSLLLNAVIVWKNLRSIRFLTVAPIVVWVMLGTIPGTLLLKVSAPWILKAILGVFVMGLGVEMLMRRENSAERPNAFLQAVICFASSMMGGLFGINLLFLIYLERTAKGREELRGSVCFVFFVENVFRMIVYGFNGVFTPLSWQLAALSIPAALIGMSIGDLIDRCIDEIRIRRIIIYMFILGGLSVLVKALLSMCDLPVFYPSQEIEKDIFMGTEGLLITLH